MRPVLAIASLLALTDTGTLWPSGPRADTDGPASTVHRSGCPAVITEGLSPSRVTQATAFARRIGNAGWRTSDDSRKSSLRSTTRCPDTSEATTTGASPARARTTALGDSGGPGIAVSLRPSGLTNFTTGCAALTTRSGAGAVEDTGRWRKMVGTVGGTV